VLCGGAWHCVGDQKVGPLTSEGNHCGQTRIQRHGRVKIRSLERPLKGGVIGRNIIALHGIGYGGESTVGTEIPSKSGGGHITSLDRKLKNQKGDRLPPAPSHGDTWSAPPTG